MGAPKGNKFALGNKGGKGGPAKYHVNYAKLAALAYNAGYIDEEVAELIGIGVPTLHRWKLHHKEFAEPQKRGKAPADERVVQSSYNRTLGFTPQRQVLPARGHGLYFLAEEPPS